jgi:tetratricopeptide (TPR) repeat protein
MNPTPTKRLLVIGATGLDWAGLEARLGSGRLPALANLRQRGTAAPVRPWLPEVGPSGWASLVTGAPPEEHGIIRPDEAWAGGLRAVGRASWRRAPLWARLNAAGISAASVGWPASRPGAAWDGDHFDDDFPLATGSNWDDWALPPRCVPPELREIARGLRTHPTDIRGEMLEPLVPGLEAIDQAQDSALPRLALIMSAAASLQSAAAWLLAERRPQALFVHQPWLGAVRAGFDAERQGPLAQVSEGAWRFFDGLVGRLSQLAGPECLIVLVSPGWRGGAGVLLAAGPGVAAGGRMDALDPLDIAPTLLARFGLEDASLRGRVVAGLAPAGPRSAAPEPPAAPAPNADADLLAQAVAAGYAPPEPASQAWRAAGLSGLAWMLVGRDPEAAGRTAEAALAIHPDDPAALAARAMAHAALGEAEPLEALGQALLRAAPGRSWGPLALGARQAIIGDVIAAGPWLAQAESLAQAEGSLEALTRIGGLWLTLSQAHEADRIFRKLLAAVPDHAPAEIGLAMAALGRADYRGAEQALQRALKLDPGRPAVYLQFASLYARTGRRLESDRALAAARRLGAAEADIAAAVAAPGG